MGSAQPHGLGFLSPRAQAKQKSPQSETIILRSNKVFFFVEFDKKTQRIQ